jgi:hypothetical protein
LDIQFESLCGHDPSEARLGTVRIPLWSHDPSDGEASSARDVPRVGCGRERQRRRGGEGAVGRGEELVESVEVALTCPVRVRGRIGVGGRVRVRVRVGVRVRVRVSVGVGVRVRVRVLGTEGDTGSWGCHEGCSAPSECRVRQPRSGR